MSTALDRSTSGTESPVATASPAANALKHGLTARRFVPPEQAERRQVMLNELNRVHAPASAEERVCVDDLAGSLARLYDVEAASWQRLQWEKANAGERFDRRMREQLAQDLDRWREEPWLWTEILGNTALGAAHLAEVWTDIAQSLECGGPPAHISRFFDAVASLRCHWQVDRVYAEGARIMSGYLALVGNPQAEIEHWIKAGRTPASGPIEDDRRRAARHLERAPEADEARSELIRTAIAQRDRWTLQANTLRSVYETQRALEADRAVGLVPGDEQATRASRLALRYLTAARNEVARAERRLENLKKMRPINALRQGSRHEPPPASTPVSPFSDDSWMLAEIQAMEAEAAEEDAKLESLEAQLEALEAEIRAESKDDDIAGTGFAGDSPFRRNAAACLRADAEEPVADTAKANRLEARNRRPDPAEAVRTFRSKSRGA